MRSDWDFLIVGAGPAGAIAACGFARSGKSVLLVDKNPWPRDKVCGCCLNLRSLRLLEEIGVTGRDEFQSAPCLKEIHLHCRGKNARLPLPGGRVVSRPVLDDLIVRAAVDLGAVFLPQIEARDAGMGQNERVVVLRSGEAETRIRAKAIIAADGLQGSFSRSLKEPGMQKSSSSRIGAGARMNESPAAIPPGTISMTIGRAGYIGMVRLEDGTLDLASAFDPSAICDAGGLGNLAESILQEARGPLPTGIAEAPWRGTPPLTVRRRKLALDRIFFAGDAAGYLEPFTGEGIAWALASGQAVVPVAMHALDRWSPNLEAEWERTYRRAVGSRWKIRLIGSTLRHPALAAPILSLLNRQPGLAGPVVHSLNRVPPHA